MKPPYWIPWLYFIASIIAGAMGWTWVVVILAALLARMVHQSITTIVNITTINRRIP